MAEEYIEDIVDIREDKVKPQDVESLIMSAINQHKNDGQLAQHQLPQNRPEQVEARPDAAHLSPQRSKMYSHHKHVGDELIDRCMSILRVPNLVEYFSAYF